MEKTFEPIANSQSIDLVDLIEQPAWKTILIDLVKTEKMDPWNIDLVDLANKYFQKIQAMERTDLKLPANAILASAILLKLKARAVRISSIEEDEEITKTISPEEIKLFEESIPELRHGRQFRQGKVTLDELVNSIQVILEKTKQKGNILREKEIPDFKIMISDRTIEAKTEEAMKRIRARADSQGIVRFSQLLDKKTPIEMVDIFIPLLFLTNKGKINLWQEIFWQEIFIALQKEGSKLPEKE